MEKEKINEIKETSDRILQTIGQITSIVYPSNERFSQLEDEIYEVIKSTGHEGIIEAQLIVEKGFNHIQVPMIISSLNVQGRIHLYISGHGYPLWKVYPREDKILSAV